MTSKIWDNRLNPSVEIMNVQHRSITECMNTILDEIADKQQSSAHINDKLDQLELLCQMHFKFDEQFLEELDYTSSSKQKLLHESFLKAIAQLRINNEQCHSTSFFKEFIKLKMDFVISMNNETMMLCDYILNTIGGNTTVTSRH